MWRTSPLSCDAFNKSRNTSFLWHLQIKWKHIYHLSERIPLPITSWCNKDESVSFKFINHLICSLRVFRGLNAELLINLCRHSHFSLLRHVQASCVFLYFCAVEVLYCSHLWKDNWVLSSWGRAWLETWQSKWREEPACLFTSPSSSAWKACLERQTMLGPSAEDRCCSSLGPTLAGCWRILDGSDTLVPVTRLRTGEASLVLKSHPLLMIHGALFFVEAAFWSSGGAEMLEDAKEKKWGETGGAHLINH